VGRPARRDVRSGRRRLALAALALPAALAGLLGRHKDGRTRQRAAKLLG
jgi:hypothetical protein